ncbi:MAG: DUF4961 domain-containing protein [Chitinophagaceae bacterium]|nr:MAG: DUF4961 domain-containing protein [Chitinophagaceae bacterium]
MKLLKSKKFRNYFLRALATAVVIVIISCSHSITTVDQPASIVAGEDLNITLKVKVTSNSAQSSRLMIAILVPKAWNARTKARMSCTTTKSTGVQAMAPVAVGVPAPNGDGLDWSTRLATKVGGGGNLIDDWEWIAYYTNASYSLGGNDEATADVFITIPTTPDNLLFKMGYAIANSTDGIGDDTRYYGSTFPPTCLEVKGDGDLIDFCNPQLSTVEPRIALDNDIITLGFDAGVTANPLENVGDIYLCATAITTTGDRIDVCTASPATKATPLGARRFRIDLWPRQFFSVTEAQTIARLEYFFTNADGSVRVGYGGLSDPFLFTFSCK